MHVYNSSAYNAILSINLLNGSGLTGFGDRIMGGAKRFSLLNSTVLQCWAISSIISARIQTTNLMATAFAFLLEFFLYVDITPWY